MTVDALPALVELVRRETGIAIKESQFGGLVAAIARLGDGMDAERLLDELTDPAAQDPLFARLVGEVTIQETYFFRDAAPFQAIDWMRLLDTARASGTDTVRIWVTACATGEEAYSLAIIASEALGSTAAVSVLATDISPRALQAAHDGIYRERSLRKVTRPVRERYFTGQGETQRISPRIRAMVRFRHHNLATEPSLPSGEGQFDLIACRNVLIYFEPAVAKRAVKALRGALRPHGTLVLGAADALTGATHEFALDGLSIAAEAPAVLRDADRPGALREPLRLRDVRPAAGSVADALAAADSGELERAVAITELILAESPLDASTYLVRGMAELALGRPADATSSLRRALYVDPSLTPAAFLLGRAHDARGDDRAARRSFRQALRAPHPDDGGNREAGDGPDREILDSLDMDDIAAACRARLEAR